ncbi:hypothetical protein SGLAM104S_00250 [Streptomyces glaucescens]
MQDDPAHPWTVAALAAKCGVSRAALARRFTELVGEPPMTHLTGWRPALAADRLRETAHTLEAIARQVGYGSAFALSTAFKRRYGVSPQEFRGRARLARVYTERAAPLVDATVWTNTPAGPGLGRVLPDGCMDPPWSEGR